MTTQMSGPGSEYRDDGTVEVHGHIGEDGNAYLFAACPLDYDVQNPNETNEVMTEILRRLDQANIWEDYWVRPEIEA